MVSITVKVDSAEHIYVYRCYLCMLGWHILHEGICTT